MEKDALRVFDKMPPESYNVNLLELCHVSCKGGVGAGHVKGVKIDRWTLDFLSACSQPCGLSGRSPELL
jgi:hypothetical protein